MPRKPSVAARTSLYRLLGVVDLASSVQAKYVGDADYTLTETDVAGRAALVVQGLMRTPTVSWAGTLHALTGATIQLGNATAAAVLLIRDEDEKAWALTYGMGFQLLDQAKVDGGFGQRIAIRTADPRDLNSLTRTTLDHRSRTDRFSIPGGDHLRGFGVGDYGEIVSRLVAKAEVKDLTGGEKPIRIRGADALSVPLGKQPEQLVNDLDALARIMDRDPPTDLAVLEQLVAIKNEPDLIRALEGDLEAALGDPAEATRLSLSWPHERIEENSPPTSFKLRGVGRSPSRKVHDGDPRLSDLLDAVGKVAKGKRLEALKGLRVMLFRDADATEPISAAIPGLQWLAFETDRDGKRYCLHDGRWYLMDQGYAEKLLARTAAILAREPAFQFPDWPLGEPEKAYNQRLAAHVGGTFLDTKLIRTVLHRRGIEACDVLSNDGALVHVKDLKASAPASHLLAQALVSTDALLHDDEARAKLRDLVEAEGGDVATVSEKVRTVVLGLGAHGGALTATSLFTFTQVTLARQVAALEAQGVEVLVGCIPRP
ncbi:DUF6119 family protein [Aquipuribacter sp. SD81]|uniref:DUF6119 family protein n=1 Tax=Aquipuribacter sp. SD81 TaxID=3127703 RepID=UPI003019D8FF